MLAALRRLIGIGHRLGALEHGEAVAVAAADGDEVAVFEPNSWRRGGLSRKRVEDNRFIRGKGNYVDDIVLPGMLHMEILRSPLAHARIKSIDTSKAWDIPGVRLVLTGEMMATRNLAWMPTLSYDTQAVLATDKVRFQGQEVACVIADDPYIAKDACEAIDRRLRAAAGDRQPDPGDGAPAPR